MKSYEKVGQLIIVLSWIIAAIVFISYVTFVLPALIPRLSFETIHLLVPFFLLTLLGTGLLIIQFKIGNAVKEHKRWGRLGGIILGAIQLFAFPVGTILGLYILWCLVYRWYE